MVLIIRHLIYSRSPGRINVLLCAVKQAYNQLNQRTVQFRPANSKTANLTQGSTHSLSYKQGLPSLPFRKHSHSDNDNT